MQPLQNEIDRRKFLTLTGIGLGVAAMGGPTRALYGEELQGATSSSLGEPVIRLEADPKRARIPVLSWDTEGGNKAQINLLRADASLELRAREGGIWKTSGKDAIRKGDDWKDGISFTLQCSNAAELTWTIQRHRTKIIMTIAGRGSGLRDLESIEMFFPFDPMVTPTTILPHTWTEDRCGRLPAVISSPDFGQVLLEESPSGVKARLEGNRDKHLLDLVLELSGVATGQTCTLTFTPLRLAPPADMTDRAIWPEIRRGWFNTWQPSARWGDQNRPFSAPAGILSNNVISDPVSFALPFYADQALWTPEIAPRISMMDQVRESIDWWLEKRTDPTGEVIGYWDYRNFLDANPGILIAAWDYVEATRDFVWLKKCIEGLEKLSAFLEKRDVDGDGIVEATQSGNYGSLIEPARSCCWWDALNCGHKDGYSNAIIYRAWRCLAELEGLLGREQQHEHATHLAERLKAAYFKTLYNPATGWLAWWKSADGQLHDYATPVVNGMAIEYGLVEPDRGRQILSLLRQKLQDVGFIRLDLGLPCTLEPVHRADYLLLPGGPGVPHRDDGTDTFQNYMNGGISAGHTLHFIMAHHIVGEPEIGDEILKAMLDRQSRVGFHNGVQNQANKGMDWTTWNGEPRGYEGYLADVFIFMQAAVLREPAPRARFYRPLTAQPSQAKDSVSHPS